ncbi:uncharacterized protein C8Q71DRAFT_773650 [Rhodofomes roseus]|uniref:Secreted protein n=1 Tax=Rhodofomes roseus TaxID=34475 RepID=A0ABQ8K9K8_9APHY|nr:uncharacterized protein C8Q71DRAFT_773650 [Rhodofomes roseus]KAH9833472.1 hypothetical protein C8Q71DRAFT_773650 [Rhodofomes roseus]
MLKWPTKAAVYCSLNLGMSISLLSIVHNRTSEGLSKAKYTCIPPLVKLLINTRRCIPAHHIQSLRLRDLRHRSVRARRQNLLGHRLLDDVLDPRLAVLVNVGDLVFRRARARRERVQLGDVRRIDVRDVPRLDVPLRLGRVERLRAAVLHSDVLLVGPDHVVPNGARRALSTDKKLPVVQAVITRLLLDYRDRVRVWLSTIAR